MDVVAFLRSSDLDDLDRAPSTTRNPNNTEKKRLKEIAARTDEIENLLYYSDDELSDEQQTALEEEKTRLEEECEALHDSMEVYTKAIMKACGAIVTVNSEGQVVVHRGVVGEEDTLPKASGKQSGAQDDTEETAAPGKSPKSPVSEKLASRLTAYRSKAMQICMADQPKMALAITVYGMVQSLNHCFGTRLPAGANLSLNFSLSSSAEDIQETPAALGLKAILTERTRQLPRGGRALLVALTELSENELVNLLAVCTAHTVNAVTGREGYVPGDMLAHLLKVDMRQWWTATACLLYTSPSPRD